MRLIDADAFIKPIEESYRSAGINNGCFKKIKRWIRIAPTIDAEPVVKCKDCKHYKPSAVASRKMCFRKDVDGVQVCYDFQPDDFCSHGERRKYETD